MSGDETAGKSKSKGLIIALIALLIIVIVLVAVIAFLLGKKQPVNDITDSPVTQQREVVDSTRLVMDEDSAASVVDEMKKQVEEGMFECKMSMTWTFEGSDSESKDAIVANSENNTHPIYFDVILKDTKEVIYSSPVIPVGSEVSNIKLDKELEPGEYKATVMYSLLKDEESQEVISQAGFVIKIVVTN